MYIALSLHLLSAVLWIGGMIFAYCFLRPAASFLDAPQRLKLWSAVFNRFFPWVWISVILLIGTGQWMVGYYGGLVAVGKYVHMMTGLGYVMALIFTYVYFLPFSQLKKNVEQESWEAAGKNLNHIRAMIAVNLLLGVTVILIASGGKYLI